MGLCGMGHRKWGTGGRSPMFESSVLATLGSLGTIQCFCASEMFVSGQIVLVNGMNAVRKR